MADVFEAFKIACDSAVSYQKIASAVAKIEGFLHPLEGSALYWLAKHWPVTGETVEIGSFKGLSTSWLARGCKDGKHGKVTAVDHFAGSPEHQPGQHYQDKDIVAFGSTLPTFQANLEKQGLLTEIDVRVGSSVVAVEGWQNPIRVLFIDGDHSYEASKLDFETWSTFVTVGGIVLFHDIGAWQGVTDFYRELSSNASWRNLGQVHTLAMMQRVS